MLNSTGPLESQATISAVSSSLTSKEGDHSHFGGHSNSPANSVALMVEVSIRTIQEKLEVACSRGVADVFSTTGRHKTVFLEAFQEYCDEVSKLEDNICQYLKVSKLQMYSHFLLSVKLNFSVGFCVWYVYYSFSIIILQWGVTCAWMCVCTCHIL